ncbi:FAD-dependent oxidoreductase [Sphaerisporangium perillae]|uniref:FAD-dependent oxidoreductase n=1 Tax=Sphaerisporangium perillae TaxID=2935860 RepID=UPI00200CD6ED|nr:FAD-dependent oxidoreductase [Sphaerisporangium perillae]
MTLGDDAREEPAEVLVAGAGPVGLTMAYELARRGVRVRLIDAREGPATTSRAIATHPRTLEVYDQMGIVEDVLPRGRRITSFTMYQRGRRLTRLEADYANTPTRFPFTIAIDQVTTEETLRAAAARLGVAVEWGVRLDGFDRHDAGVRVRLTHSRGEAEQAEVPWLVGCDGGHSTVRKILGLPLLGESSETWLIADAQVETGLPRDSIYWVRCPGVTMMMVPMIEPGRWRLLDTAAVEHDPRPASVAERFNALIAPGVGCPFQVAEPSWISVFTFQQRMTPRMRVGRCLVAGDAAHVHSPASGQGMNTGIQEAYNLSWKLAMVVRGQAREELLDSYGEERVPVGRTLLASTKKATRIIQLKNPVLAGLLPVVFAVMRAVPPLRVRMQRAILGGVSGLGLHYGAGSLTTPAKGSAAGPRPGERVTQADAAEAAEPAWKEMLAELRDPRWTLLAYVDDPGGAAAATAVWADERHGAWLSVRTVSARLSPGLPNPLPAAEGVPGLLAPREGRWLLIRPDGYLAADGEALTRDALAAALERVPLTSPVRPEREYPSAGTR